MLTVIRQNCFCFVWITIGRDAITSIQQSRLVSCLFNEIEYQMQQTK